MNAILTETKEDKLAHYAKHEELKRFAQYDGWYMPDGGDDVMHPDRSGHAMTAGFTNELMHGMQDVRVLVTDGADKEQVVALLLKIALWVQSDGYPLDHLLKPAFENFPAPPPDFEDKLTDADWPPQHEEVPF